MRILVTGGNGFIGYHLVKDLLEKGNQVTVIDPHNFDDYIKELLLKYPESFKLISCDLRYHYIPTYFDQVYHLAAMIGTKDNFSDPYSVISTNIKLIKRLVKDFKNKNCKIVFVSTSEVVSGIKDRQFPTPEDSPVAFENPFDPRWAYALSKFMAEEILVTFANRAKFKYSIARLGNVYGPRMIQDYVVKSMIKRTLSKENPFEVRSANDTRSFIYVSDVIEGLERLMDTPEADGQVVNLSVPFETPISDLAEAITHRGDTEFDLVEKDNPNPEYRLLDLEKAKVLLGWEPQVFLDEGLDKTFDWYKRKI